MNQNCTLLPFINLWLHSYNNPFQFSTRKRKRNYLNLQRFLWRRREPKGSQGPRASKEADCGRISSRPNLEVIGPPSPSFCGRNRRKGLGRMFRGLKKEEDGLKAAPAMAAAEEGELEQGRCRHGCFNLPILRTTESHLKKLWKHVCLKKIIIIMINIKLNFR